MEPWTNLPEYESQSDDILDCVIFIFDRASMKWMSTSLEISKP